MKWRSKATGTIFNVYDSFNNNTFSHEHSLALFLEKDDLEKTRPRAVLGYSELIEAFEKVEE